MRIAIQGFFNIGLTEGNPGLAHITGIGTQHADFPSGQTGRQHQAVKAVIFQPVIPYIREGILKALLAGIQIQGAARMQHGKIQDPEGFVTAIHFIGRFANHSQPQIFQHGQHIGQMNGLGPVIEL